MLQNALQTKIHYETPYKKYYNKPPSHWHATPGGGAEVFHFVDGHRYLILIDYQSSTGSIIVRETRGPA